MKKSQVRAGAERTIQCTQCGQRFSNPMLLRAHRPECQSVAAAPKEDADRKAAAALPKDTHEAAKPAEDVGVAKTAAAQNITISSQPNKIPGLTQLDSCAQAWVKSHWLPCGAVRLATTASGVTVLILREDAAAPAPTSTSKVELHYTGCLAHERFFFDGTRVKGDFAPFEVDLRVGGVVPGFTEAIHTMRLGTRAVAYIPSELAYGAHGIPRTIPPHSGLSCLSCALCYPALCLCVSHTHSLLSSISISISILISISVFASLSLTALLSLD